MFPKVTMPNEGLCAEPALKQTLSCVDALMLSEIAHPEEEFVTELAFKKTLA